MYDNFVHSAKIFSPAVERRVAKLIKTETSWALFRRISGIRRIGPAVVVSMLLIGGGAQYGCSQNSGSDLVNDTSHSGGERASAATIKWNPRVEAADLTQAEFTEICADVVRGQMPGATVKVVKPLEISCSPKEGSENKAQFKIFLDNAWRASSSSPGARKRLLEPYFASLSEYEKVMETSGRAAIDQVVPLVRTKAILDGLGQGAKLSLVSEPLGGELNLIYGLDSSNAISYLSAEQRSKIKLNQGELREKARSNLVNLVGKNVTVQAKGEVYRVLTGGDYDSSAIFLDEVMNTLKQKVKGRMIFAVPCRSLFMVTGDQSQEAISLIRQVTKKQFETGDHVISDRLYRYDDGKITFYE